MRLSVSLKVVQRALAAAALLAIVLPTTSAEAQLRIGGRVGGNFNQLSQPNDPAGEPTVLFGSAFTGAGFIAGATSYYDITQVGPGPIFLNVDLLLSHNRGTAFAESRTSDARRELTIHTTGLRLPVLGGIGFEGSSTTFEMALGPEVLLGLMSGSKVTQSGIRGGDPGTLETRATSGVALTAKLGMLFEMGAGALPLDIRFSWNPFVPGSTRERFDGYVDMDNPGRYGVAFDLQAMVTMGYVFDIGGS